MSYSAEPSSYGMFAADASADARIAFIRRTYLHLSGAILMFAGLEAIIFNTPALRDGILSLMFTHWWVAIVAFIGASWVAQWWAHNAASQGLQYAGLATYAVIQAIIFVPLLYVASRVGGPDSNIIPTAGLLTVVIFGGLSAIVFTTRADFSFLRVVLWLATLGAMGIAVAAAIFGFNLGVLFAGGMVVLASGWILYDTSNVLHHYRTDQHVGAALELFASVVLLFWYLIRLLTILNDSR